MRFGSGGCPRPASLEANPRDSAGKHWMFCRLGACTRPIMRGKSSYDRQTSACDLHRAGRVRHIGVIAVSSGFFMNLLGAGIMAAGGSAAYLILSHRTLLI